VISLPLAAQEKSGRPFPPLITDAAAAQHQKFVVGRIPKLDEVESIRAEVSIGPPYGPEVAPFKLPPEFVDPMLKLFQEAKIDTDPILSMPEMGSLLITQKGGKSKERICFYCGAQGAPLMFSIDGVRCVSTAPWDPKKGEAVGQVFELIQDAKRKVGAPSPVQPERDSGRRF